MLVSSLVCRPSDRSIPRFVPARIALLSVPLALSGCSGGVSPPFTGDLYVESCNLACTDGDGGAQVACSIVDVAENIEIAVTFSEPIDPATLNASSFQVIDVANGTTPDGSRFLDPLDPRRVVFRPTVSFSLGLEFSLQRNRSYEIFLPGEAQGDAGPFLRSTTGNPNQSRMSCTIRCSEGVEDSVPGNPEVVVSADALLVDELGEPVLDAGGDPIRVRRTLGTDDTDPVGPVALDSAIFFEFNEIMSIPTVANNVFNTAPFIAVELDGDGDASTAGPDRTPIEGSYFVSIDQERLTTSVEFRAFDSLPAAAADDSTPALLVVRVPNNVLDISGNPVTTETGGGSLFAVPEAVEFDPVVLPSEGGEGFDLASGQNGSLEAASETGAVWGSGQLTPGLTGGSGRHGSLRLSNGVTVVLNTDEQRFPIDPDAPLNLLTNSDATGVYPSEIVETSGVFEFTTLQVAPGARLILEGSQPARILVRGTCIIAAGGLVDASGGSAPAHDSTVVDTEDYFALFSSADEVPRGGPGGSLGGFGGDRINYASNAALLGIGAVENPGSQRNGRAGGGVGGTTDGRGNGGPAFPASLPTALAADEATLGGIGFNVVLDPLDELATLESCVSIQIGGVGSGAGYALSGGDGVPLPAFPSTESPVRGTAPNATAGGAAVALEAADADNVGYTTRKLRWDSGDLRGGAGGGGGGNHVYGTLNSAQDPVDAVECTVAGVELSRWNDHSGAAGGGGGGALEILTGRSLVVRGAIDVRGGDGGSSASGLGALSSFAMPGGGGSGGSLRLRSPEVDIRTTAVLNVAGGVGGNAPWSLFMDVFTRGGDGGPGLLRVEDGASELDFADVTLRARPLGDMPERWASVAPGYLDETTVSRLRPNSLSGAVSCWMRPEGAFTSLNFRADESGQTSVESKGWTMDLRLGDGSTRPFRGTDSGDPDWELLYGNLLGYDLQPGEEASPIVVRFQGARSIGQSVLNPCDVNLDALPVAGVVAGSVTPWVAHPADLVELRNASGALFNSTMVRYVVVFDATIDPGAADTPGQILINEDIVGVDNVRIEADPR